jgi:hypothetical protein
LTDLLADQMIAPAMSTDIASRSEVVASLQSRLLALNLERDQLAARVRDLEAQVTAARAAAEDSAAEALHITALVAFYETSSDPGTVAASAPGLIEAPDEVGVEEQPPETAATASPRRRATPSWTVAWRDEAVAVLKGQGAPMHYRELYRAIAARGFTFGGKSPEASFLASLSRDQTTIVGVGRGCYWLAGETQIGEAVRSGPRRRARRPKPIGTRR